MGKIGISVSVFLAGALWASTAAAGGSCAYQEGIIALERGQSARAETMLAIAAREGNLQAQRLLEQHFPGHRLLAANTRLTSRVEDRRADPAK